MNGPLTDTVRIRHILDAIEETENYLNGISLDAFIASSEKRFATIKQIEIRGEACRHISDTIKQAHRKLTGVQSTASGISLFTNTSVLTFILFGKSHKTICLR